MPVAGAKRSGPSEGWWIVSGLLVICPMSSRVLVVEKSLIDRAPRVLSLNCRFQEQCIWMAQMQALTEAERRELDRQSLAYDETCECDPEIIGTSRY